MTRINRLDTTFLTSAKSLKALPVPKIDEHFKIKSPEDTTATYGGVKNDKTILLLKKNENNRVYAYSYP